MSCSDLFLWLRQRQFFGPTLLGLPGAVEYAQCSRLGILLQHGVARVPEFLTLHGAMPRGLLQIGVIVNDLVVLEQVLRSAFEEMPFQADGTFSHARMERATAAYREVGLVTNPKMAVRADPMASYWGVASRACCVHLNMGWNPSTVVRLSDALVDELMAVAVIGTLAMVNLPAPFTGFVTATDASSNATAAVRAPISLASCARAVQALLEKRDMGKGAPSRQSASEAAWAAFTRVLSSCRSLPIASFVGGGVPRPGV